MISLSKRSYRKDRRYFQLPPEQRVKEVGTTPVQSNLGTPQLVLSTTVRNRVTKKKKQLLIPGAYDSPAHYDSPAPPPSSDLEMQNALENSFELAQMLPPGQKAIEYQPLQLVLSSQTFEMF